MTVRICRPSRAGGGPRIAPRASRQKTALSASVLVMLLLVAPLPSPAAASDRDRAPGEEGAVKAAAALAVAADLYRRGVAAHHRGELSQAADSYRQALALRQEHLPDSAETAENLVSLGVVSSNLGDLPGALDYFTRALAHPERLSFTSLEVAVGGLDSLGILARGAGELAAAEEYYRRALPIVEKLWPDSLVLAARQINMGLIAAARGRLAVAEDYLRRAATTAEQVSPSNWYLPASISHLADIARRRGDLALAEDYYLRALTLFDENAPSFVNQARVLTELGTLARAQGRLAMAEDYSRRALTLFEGRAEEVYFHGLSKPATLGNLGSIAVDRGELATANGYYQRAFAMYQRIAPGSLQVAIGLHDLAEVAYRQGQLAAAEESFRRALGIRERLAPGSLAEAESAHRLGMVLWRLHRTEAAEELLDRAVVALERQLENLGGSHNVRAGFRARHRRYYQTHAQLTFEQGRLEETFEIQERSRARSFLAMLAERDLLFADLPEELERARRRNARRYDQAQRQLAGLSLQGDEEEIETIHRRLRELRRERDALAQEIVRASPRLAGLRYPEPLRAGDIRNALDDGTALVAYSVTDQQTQLFLITPGDELRVEAVPVTEKQLRREVERFRALIRKARPGTPHLVPTRALGKRLFAQLIGPVADVLDRSTRLLIVPDGPLHLLPWGALIKNTDPGATDSPRNGQYLVEWKPFHSALSATVYAQLKATRTKTVPAGSPVTLAAFGDPHYPPELRAGDPETIAIPQVRAASRRGFEFAPLPATRAEVQGIAELFSSGVRTYLGTEAREERAKSLPRDVRYLHFATHATLDPLFPLDSALALTIPRELAEGRDNGLLQAWEIFERLRLDADLVVLSACESALGRELGGEGLIGLTRAFHYAGARTVAASLWNVADRTTAALMVSMYRHLRSGKPKDEALQAAQIELIRQPIVVRDEAGRKVEKDASAPYYWAAFQIYGDWQ